MPTMYPVISLADVASAYPTTGMPVPEKVKRPLVGSTAYCATTVSAQYAVDPTSGRFTFSGTGIPVVGYALATSASDITGYIVGIGASAASGTMEFQTSSYPPGYQFGPIIGQYGLGSEEMLDPQSTVIVGNEFPARNGQLGTSAPSVNYLY